MNAWYEQLVKPALTPPDWVFAPVWTVLYVMIAVSIVLYYRQPRKVYPVAATVILAVHLVTNFIWTYLFFGLRSPALALADIVVLDLTLLVLVALFLRASIWSGLLLVPYGLWVLFATYLNLMFARLN